MSSLYYSPERAMLIDEGTTLSPSQNSSPDIILAVANPDNGCPGRGGDLETLEGISALATTQLVTLTIDLGPTLRTPLGVEGTNDDHHEGGQGQGEPALTTAP